MVIYLSGPMTGLPEHNFPVFNRYARALRNLGHQVLNPAENDGGSTDKSYAFYFELDVSNVLVAECVCVLPNWELSKGARLEVALAQTIGRPIYHVEEFLKNPKPVPVTKKVNTVVDF